MNEIYLTLTFFILYDRVEMDTVGVSLLLLVRLSHFGFVSWGRVGKMEEGVGVIGFNLYMHFVFFKVVCPLYPEGQVTFKSCT